MFEPINIILRVVLALVFLLSVTRLLTKRSLSNLTYFDYVAGVILGTVAGNLAFNIKIHILNFLLALTVITLIMMIFSHLSLKCASFRKVVAGEPTVIIQKGKILENNMARLNYTFDYLNQQLRQEKVFDISQVEFAILEPSGQLSIQLKSQNRPLTPQDIHLPTQYEGLATEIVLDGQIIKENLERKGLSQEWLFMELKKRGIEDIKKIAFAAMATNGNLYVDLYCD